MTTQTTESAATPPPESKKRSWVGALWVGIALVLLALIAANARMGAVSPRIRNPEVTGAPRPVEPLFGYQHWLGLFQIFTIITMLIIIAVYVVVWRRHPAHPVLLMGIVTTLIVWQDPIMNWSPYAVYNPQLWHWPEDWPLASISPTVEPFLVIGYIMFYLGPYFPAIWILRKIQARRPHELVCVAPSADQPGVDHPARRHPHRRDARDDAGAHWVLHLLASHSLRVRFRWTAIPIPVHLGIRDGDIRDDPGGCAALPRRHRAHCCEKLARRARIFPSRPALGMFVVMFVIINLAYFAYGTGFAVIKWTRTATSVACPWPYPEAKVYDPQGFYEKNGQPGPYSVGIWSTWMSAQPSGRPNVLLGSESEQCAPKQ